MGFMDKMKNAIGIEDAYYDDDEYEEENGNYYENEETTSSEDGDYDSYGYDGDGTYDTDNRSSVSSHRAAHVVNMTTSSPRLKIQIEEPLDYSNGPKIIDHVLARRSVVLNLEMLEVDKKRQIFDFVSGGVYALGGNMEKVTKDIYVVVPKGVAVDGKMAEAVSEQASKDSLYQI